MNELDGVAETLLQRRVALLGGGEIEDPLR